MYYIMSLKWTRSGEEAVTFWGPGNSGYVLNLNEAGRYSDDQVTERCSYYDNRENTIALPCDIVDKYAIRIVHFDAISKVISETLGVNAYVHAPFEPSLDDDGKPYECKECEHRPTYKGPSKLVIRGPVK